MKVFDPDHAKGDWWFHFKKAGFISGLFICSGLIGLIHAIAPFFLPEFLTLAHQRIRKELDRNEH